MAHILVVDHDRLSRELLQARFKDGRHQLWFAETAEHAIRLASAQSPDLVLLAVELPGMSGFEAIAPLRDAAGDTFLPIILVALVADPHLRRTGLALGADHVITPPYDEYELALRIRNLLALRDKQAAFCRRNRALAEANRGREEMAELIVHDLKNRIAVVSTNVATFMRDERDEGRLGSLRDCQNAIRCTSQLLRALLDVPRLESNRFGVRRAPLDVVALLKQTAMQRAVMAQSRRMTFRFDSAADIPSIAADADLLGRVFENIVDNALQYAPCGGQIALQVQFRGDIEIRIGNGGPAIPSDLRSVVFEKYRQIGAGTQPANVGIGLYFCKLAVEAHGGRIWVEETSEFPTVFVLSLPARE